MRFLELMRGKRARKMLLPVFNLRSRARPMLVLVIVLHSLCLNPASEPTVICRGRGAGMFFSLVL
jgi:hypothetical protein